jgi:predicted secreted protein
MAMRPATAHHTMHWYTHQMTFARKNQTEMITAAWNNKQRTWYVSYSPWQRSTDVSQNPKAMRTATAHHPMHCYTHQMTFTSMNQTEIITAAWNNKQRTWYVSHLPWQRSTDVSQNPKAMRTATSHHPMHWYTHQMTFTSMNQTDIITAAWNNKQRTWCISHSPRQRSTDVSQNPKAMRTATAHHPMHCYTHQMTFARKNQTEIITAAWNNKQRTWYISHSPRQRSTDVS